MYEVLTKADRRANRRVVPDDGVVVTHTGLSVMTRGHLIDVVRYEVAKVAVIRVVVVDRTASQADPQDLKRAADTFAERVRRSLGQDWDIVRWEPADEQQAPVPLKGKVAGYIDEPWRSGV